MVDYTETVFGGTEKILYKPSERAKKCCRLVVILGAYGHVGALESNFKGALAKKGGTARGRNL